MFILLLRVSLLVKVIFFLFFRFTLLRLSERTLILIKLMFLWLIFIFILDRTLSDWHQGMFLCISFHAKFFVFLLPGCHAPTACPRKLMKQRLALSSSVSLGSQNKETTGWAWIILLLIHIVFLLLLLFSWEIPILLQLIFYIYIYIIIIVRVRISESAMFETLSIDRSSTPSKLRAHKHILVV